jgi:quinol monooxygenase YgiN
MYAREIRATIVPGHADAAIAAFRDHVVPVIRTKPGYLSTAIFVDREHGEAATLSLWESREAAEATGKGSEYLTEVVAMLRQHITNREYRYWEVGCFDRAD